MAQRVGLRLRVGVERRLAAAGAPTHEILAQGNSEDGEDLHAGGRGGARRQVVGVGIVNDDGMHSRLSDASYQ